MASCWRKALVIILGVSLWLKLASSARYEWRKDWKVFNHANSTKELTAGQRYGTYRLIATAATGNEIPILSDNGTIGLSFLNFNGTGQYFLSVMLGVKTGSAVPIWTANRNAPVSEGAALQILSGEMRLVDKQGNRVWSPFQLGIRGIELQESGNFRLFDDQDTTLWQSFQDMTDVLMPGQKFRTGSKLIGNLSPSSMADGSFVTSMEPSGFALYLTAMQNGSGPMVPPQAYSISTMQNTSVKRQLSTVLKECPSYQAVFLYSGADFELGYEAKSAAVDSQPCAPHWKAHFPFVDTRLSIRFLRLEYTGDLVSFGYDTSARQWKADFSWVSLVRDKVCAFPLSCGSYGLCQSAGCKCLSEKTRGYDIVSGNKVCLPPPATRLTKCGDPNQLVDFVSVLGVRYFANRLLQPDMLASLDICLRACKNNCSCSAAFYDKDSRGCYFVEEILGSLDYDATNVLQYSAHLKFGDVQPGGQMHHLNHAKLATIVAVPLVGILAAAALVLGMTFARRKRQLSSESRIINALLSAMPGAGVATPPHRFSFNSLSTATKGFAEMLGSGGFGPVFAGTLPNGTKLAVKRLEAMQTMQGEKEFTAEVVSLGSISHVNIVRLCGFCVKGSVRLLVYELVANGSLDKWLFEGQRDPLSWSLRMQVALGTAKGLSYLHEECREPILHLDVKPQNILLDDDFTPKLADFGMSKLLSNREITQVVTGVRGTPGYVAPEWIINSVATKKCDVYSYGMVLFELVSGRRNVDIKLPSDRWYFPKWVVQEMKDGRMMNSVDGRIKSPSIVEQVERVLRVALCCIQTNASARPSMALVVQMLEGSSSMPELVADLDSLHVYTPQMATTTTTSDLTTDTTISSTLSVTSSSLQGR